MEKDNPKLKYESLKSHNEHSEKASAGKKAIVGLLLALTVATGATGCSATKVEKSKTKIEEKAPSQEKKAAPSESEAEYTEYLTTLTPEQRAVRESLNPDAIAKMTEVIGGDGEIDAGKYMEAFLARNETLMNLGSDTMFKKLRNLSFDLQLAEVQSKYYVPAKMALFGDIPSTGYEENAKITFKRASTVYDTMKSSHGPKPTESFRFREKLVPDSVTSTKGENGWKTIVSTEKLDDNWPKKIMSERYGLVIEPTDSTVVSTITGLHVTDNGVVVGTKYEVTE
jgi:hypothetical protein